MGEVSINQSVFNSMVSHAKTARTDLEGVKAINFTLKDTDLKSIKEQLNVIKDFQNALTLYNKLLETDLNKLQAIGDSMVQQDEQLANLIKK
ncbi:TIGR04197 family type VII secretion effector [Rummeliibacillus pycnus]|uniref:TIGR04197 family type VII secretion effector n=1 Tax=Rummeliibacillus pycnus TaxID=101070 RepID=UPI003D2A1D59